jgi:hypothetical protein
MEPAAAATEVTMPEMMEALTDDGVVDQSIMAAV